jgi:hypothetical protein
MDFFTELKEQTFVTTSDAIAVIFSMTTHYCSVLDNIIKIKQQASTDTEEESFRRKTDNADVLTELADSLRQLERDVSHVEQVFINQQASLEQCNKQLLKVLSKAIQRCEAAYENKSRSFAMILQDLERLHHLLQAKLTLSIQEGERIAATQTVKKPLLEEHQKLVYVRVFHKEMAKLGTRQGVLTWVKPLLESLKFAEKHGLAIFDDEQLVKKSLKNECYGYITLKINQEQDISRDYPNKFDQNMEVPLLTINNITLEQMLKLTHLGVEYPIVDGKLQPPKKTVS